MKFPRRVTRIPRRRKRNPSRRGRGLRGIVRVVGGFRAGLLTWGGRVDAVQRRRRWPGLGVRIYALRRGGAGGESWCWQFGGGAERVWRTTVAGIGGACSYLPYGPRPTILSARQVKCKIIFSLKKVKCKIIKCFHITCIIYYTLAKCTYG